MEVPGAADHLLTLLRGNGTVHTTWSIPTDTDRRVSTARKEQETMSKVYSVEVMICATAYIRADSAAEAAQIANEKFRENTKVSPLESGMCVDASTDASSFGDVEVSDARFDSEELPDVSLSPAMTFMGHAGTGDARWTADDAELIYE